MNEKANYTHYAGDLGRTLVPDAETFNKYLLENLLYVNSLVTDGLISGERTENGIDSAICLCVEVDYITDVTINSAPADDGEHNGILTSESIQGYSYSLDTSARQKALELNAESAKAKKLQWIKAFCRVTEGWRL